MGGIVRVTVKTMNSSLRILAVASLLFVGVSTYEISVDASGEVSPEVEYMSVALLQQKHGKIEAGAALVAGEHVEEKQEGNVSKANTTNRCTFKFCSAGKKCCGDAFHAICCDSWQTCQTWASGPE